MSKTAADPRHAMPFANHDPRVMFGDLVLLGVDGLSSLNNAAQCSTGPIEGDDVVALHLMRKLGVIDHLDQEQVGGDAGVVEDVEGPTRLGGRPGRSPTRRATRRRGRGSASPRNASGSLGGLRNDLDELVEGRSLR